MIFVYILLSSQMLIKHWNSTLYMAMDPNVMTGRRPVSVSKTEATNWDILPEFAPKKRVIVQAPNTSYWPEVLEVNTQDRTLETFVKEEGNSKQMFTFFPHPSGQGYWINGKGWCVTYVENARNYVMKQCGAPNQQFELVPEEIKLEEPIENPLEDSVSPVYEPPEEEEEEEVPDIIDPQTGIVRGRGGLRINPKERGGYEARGSDSWRLAGERAAMGGASSGGRGSVSGGASSGGRGYVTGGAALGGSAARGGFVSGGSAARGGSVSGGNFVSGGGSSSSGGASLGRISTGGGSGCPGGSLVGGQTEVRTQNGMLVGSSGMNIMMEAGARSVIEERNKSKQSKKNLSISSESTIGPNTCNLGFLHE